MSVIGGKPKPNRVTVQVVENGKHYAKHTVYTDAATVDRLVRGALHRAVVERDNAYGCDWPRCKCDEQQQCPPRIRETSSSDSAGEKR